MLDKEKSTQQTPEIGYRPALEHEHEHKKFPTRQKLIPSFVSGLQDFVYGENYTTIFKYFWPELISAFILQSAANMADALFIAHLKSTSTQGILSVTSNFIHFLLKVAEGLSIGATVLSGQYNGLGNFKAAGKAMRDSFWVTVIVGATISSLLFGGAYWIYALYGVPTKMIALGTPFLRLRATGTFFMFVYLALIGFMRGIKNTHIPMRIYLAGAIVYLFFDYVLILGKFGFPALGLQGAAIAYIIQYAFMCTVALLYLALHEDTKQYELALLSSVSDWANVKRLLHLSWPAILDKATFAASYIWLGAMVASMGKYVITTCGVIKDLERLAFLPAVAFAQVVTFLVSNAYSVQDWQGIKSSVKKILFLAVTMVSSILFVFSLYAERIIQWFDHKGKFTDFAATVLPFVSILAFFDVVQIILSGALRGAGNVKTVMAVRAAVCFGYFIPVSYLISQLPIQSSLTKFLLIYGSFYIGNALMSIAYIQRFRGDRWKGTII